MVEFLSLSLSGTEYYFLPENFVNTEFLIVKSMISLWMTVDKIKKDIVFFFHMYELSRT